MFIELRLSFFCGDVNEEISNSIQRLLLGSSHNSNYIPKILSAYNWAPEVTLQSPEPIVKPKYLISIF